MLCPNCPDHRLDIVNTSAGTLLLCSECGGFFVPVESLALFSTDRVRFLQAVEETQSLRLPTSRICPACNSSLQQGRVRSAGVVLTLCDTCHSLWTHFETLERLEYGVAFSLRAFLVKPTMTPGPVAIGAPAPAAAAPILPVPEESRDFALSPPSVDFPPAPAEPPAVAYASPPNAEWQDKYAELLQRYETLEKELRSSMEKRETEMTQRQSAQIQKSQDSLHQTLQEKLVAAEAEAKKHLKAFTTHVSELEQKRLILEAEIKGLKARVDSMESERSQLSQQQIRREEEIKRQYAEDLKKNQEALKDLEQARQKQDKELQDYRHQMEALARKPPVSEPPLKQPVSETPPRIPVSEPPLKQPEPVKPIIPVKPTEPMKPVVVKPPEPVRAEKKPAGPSFFSLLIDGFRSAWSPRPSSKPATAVPKPVAAEKPVPAPAPAPAPKAAPIAAAPKPVPEPVKPVEKPVPAPMPAPGPAVPTSVPVKPVEKAAPPPARVEKKPAGPSFFSLLIDGFRSAWTPRPSPKPATAAPKPVAAEKPVPAPAPAPKPAPAPVKPIEKPAPAPVPAMASTPAPIAKAPVQKPASGNSDWIEMVMHWSPRTAPVVVFFLVKAASYYGEVTTAFAWALIVWGVLYGVRLKRLYPTKDFAPATVAGLSDLKQATAWRGAAVTLQGKLTFTTSAKGLSFTDATGSIPLNVLSMLEWMPRIFGLSTPNQFPPGDLVLKGWLRKRKELFVEVGDARNDKTSRHSLVKTLRWITVWVVLVLAVGILITADPGY